MCPSPGSADTSNYGISTRATKRENWEINTKKGEIKGRQTHAGYKLKEIIEERMEEFKRELLSSLCERMKREMTQMQWVEPPPPSSLQKRLREIREEINPALKERKERDREEDGEERMDIVEEKWSEVVERKASMRSKDQSNRQRSEHTYMRRMNQSGKRIPRPPRRAAITLTVAPGSNTKYAEIMKEVRRVKLNELRIEDIAANPSQWWQW